MRGLIVTADDFGAAIEVNEAVERGHVNGVLSAASLMVGGPAAKDAIARAVRLSSLRVGLHLVLVDGKPVLPPTEIPALVQTDGSFRGDMTKLAIAIAFDPRVRRQAEAEIAAQFEAYRASGLQLDHVNMHKHFQLHPTLARIVIAVGRRFGMRAMRIPREPQQAFRLAGERVNLSALALNAWAAGLRRRLQRVGMNYCDHVFGLRWTGAMTASRLLQIVLHLPDAPCEIYMHPATENHFSSAAFGYRYRDELDALTDPAVAAAIGASGRRLGGYGDVID